MSGLFPLYPGVAESADVRDLGSRVERRRGSNPLTRTIIYIRAVSSAG